MAATAYVDDVFQVAQSILKGYYLGSPLRERLPDAVQSDMIEFRVYVPGNELRPALAVVHALQLAVDAASVAVEYVETASDSGAEFSFEHVRGLVAQAPLVELEIVHLGQGSFRVRLRLNPKTQSGRR